MKKVITSISVLFMVSSCSKHTDLDTKPVKKEEATVVNQSSKVENFLNLPQTINFKGTDFNLSWSSHPSANYYKQEFIPKDNVADKYTQMIIDELVVGDITAKDAISQKIQELEARKATDRLAKYQVSENKETKEFLLDFMLSEGNGDENTIVEWNIYRYTNFTDKAGRKGVSLFALSKRGYGHDILPYVNDLKENRLKYVSDFVALNNPQINLK